MSIHERLRAAEVIAVRDFFALLPTVPAHYGRATFMHTVDSACVQNFSAEAKGPVVDYRPTFHGKHLPCFNCMAAFMPDALAVEFMDASLLSCQFIQEQILSHKVVSHMFLVEKIMQVASCEAVLIRGIPQHLRAAAVKFVRTLQDVYVTLLRLDASLSTYKHLDVDMVWVLLDAKSGVDARTRVKVSDAASPDALAELLCYTHSFTAGFILLYAPQHVRDTILFEGDSVAFVKEPPHVNTLQDARIYREDGLSVTDAVAVAQVL